MINNKYFYLVFNGGERKKASIIISFNFRGEEFLIYSLEENDNNCQIFVSKLQKNTENNYFLTDILLNEKENLSKLTYNLVILLPTNVKKGLKFENVYKSLFENVDINLFDKELLDQNYCINSAVAITKKDFVVNALEIYNSNLSILKNDLPVWSLPKESTIPFVSNTLNSNQISFPSNIQNLSNCDSNVIADSSQDILLNTNEQSNYINAEISDPSLNKFGINTTKSNSSNFISDSNGNNNLGFTNSKYIIIGTISLLLSVVIVVIAYFLIKNIK